LVAAVLARQLASWRSSGRGRRFLLIYVFLCAYIIVEIIGDEIAG
jgi:hypothetical protein